MIVILLYILISVVLTGIIYQDIKLRAIHFALPLLLVACTIALWCLTSPLEIIEILYSTGFLVLCLLAIIVQYSIKEKAIKNPFNKVFGVGDIVYLIAIVPLFSFRNYLLFIVTGMVFALIFHIIMQQFQQETTIPLAGYLSLYLIIIMGILAINQQLEHLYINIF